jgi:hypothetical protein
MNDRLKGHVARTGKMVNAYPGGLKLKSYAGRTDNFKIRVYGGPHGIFSNIKLSVLFKIKNNIKIVPLHYYLISSILRHTFF